MPGIIVSRPIFNTLFKLAHDEGLSINAFLTKLLEKSGPEAVSQAAASAPAAAQPVTQIQGAEQDGPVPVQSQPTAPEIKPIRYEQAAEESEARVDQGTGELAAPRRIGNTVWDKVVSMEGHRFATSRGKKFSYKVTGEYIVVRDSQARIPRSQFDKAQKMWPVTGPSRLVGVYAPSVVWAVMKELNEAEEPAMA